MVEVICFALLILLIGNLQVNQVAATEKRQIDIERLRSILLDLESKGDIKTQEKEYILANINREDLLPLFSGWESKGIVFANDVKLYLLLEYLQVEFSYLGDRSETEVRAAGKLVMPFYLNAIMHCEQHLPLYILWANKLDMMPIPPQYGGMCTSEKPDEKKAHFAYPTRNVYGRLHVESIPKQSEVHINGRFVDYADKEFVLGIGGYSISVEHVGYRNYVTSVVIESGKMHSVECQLQKQ